MKNTREPDEEELKSRLRNYTEEPGPEMWEGISIRLAKPGNDSIFTEWPNLLSGIVLISLSFMSYQTQESMNREASINQIDQTRFPIAANTALPIVESPRETPSRAHVTNIQSIPPGQSATGVGTEWASSDKASQDESLSSSIVESPQQSMGDSQVLSTTSFLATAPKSDSSRVETAAPARKDTSVTVLGIVLDDRPGRRHYVYTAYLTVTPMLGFQRVEFNTGDNIVVAQVDDRPVLSSDRFGFHLAIGMEIPLSKKFTMNGGFTYLQRNLRFTYTEKVLDSTSFSTSPNGGITLTPNFSYPKREFNYDFRSAGLQVGILYKLSSDKPRTLTVEDALGSGSMMPRKRFVHFVGGGLEWQWTINRTTAVNNPYGYETPAGYSFVNVYYRLQYPHAGRWKAILQPTFNYSFFSNQTTNGLVRIKPYGFGISLGCNYTF